MPDINTIEESMADRLLSAYQNFDLPGLNEIVNAILSLPRHKSIRKQTSTQQLEFEFVP